MSPKTVDAEMLKDLELLMEWDSLQEEPNWEALSQENSLEDSDSDNDSEEDK